MANFVKRGWVSKRPAHRIRTIGELIQVYGNKQEESIYLRQDMRSRLLYSKIWNDKFFMNLNPHEKLLFIYFITNDAINIIHLYEAPLRVIVFETGLDEAVIENAKNKFQANKKLHFYNDYVYIVNAYRYQTYKGERNETAKSTLFAQLPKDVLDWFYSISDTSQIGVYIPSEIKTKTEIKYETKTNAEDIDLDEVDEAIKMATDN